MQKYKDKNGNIGVLLSTSYGTGWSTGSPGVDAEFRAMDKELVDLKLQGATEEEAWEYIELSAVGFEDPDMDVWDTLRVQWLPEGTKFRINSYDGKESIVTMRELEFTA